MVYTVKELAKISNVSVRTLHWYDAIGLLKPLSKGLNNYRYYGEQELLRLQQILFFKELGFSLNGIQKILSQDGFDSIKTLNAHRETLENQIDRKNELIATIDKTIQLLRGKESMKDEELYYGFNVKLPKSEQYMCVSRGTAAEKILEHFKKNDDTVWTEQQWSAFKNEVDSLDKRIAALITKAVSPENEEVQSLIERHYELQSNFFDLTHQAYLALIEMYEENDSTIKMFFEAYHPEMQKFMCKAMRHYAHKNL